MFAPVCGTNNQSYSNPCLLELAACDNPTIKMAYIGNCKDESSKILFFGILIKFSFKYVYGQIILM